MKKGLRITLYIIFAIIFVTSMLVIDYSVAKITGNRPVVAIKKEYKKEQYIEYSGLFYKMWICTSEENNYKVGRFKQDAPVCPKLIEFKNKIYTTFNDIQISQKDYAMISNYYNYDLINDWTKEDELAKALFISEQINNKKFSTKEGYYATYNRENYMIAMFETFTEDENGNWSWKINESNIENHYCIKYNDDKTKFLISKYNGSTCDGNFNELTYTQEWCEIVKENKISSTVKSLAKENCK